MSSADPERETDASRRVREQLSALDAAVTPPRHDASVLAGMRAAATRIQARRARPSKGWPLALAASFVLGVVGTLALDGTLRSQLEGAPHLTIPSGAVRGAANGTETPVEQADPAVWYRYIQELLYAGEREEALQHLKRFNELHPD